MTDGDQWQTKDKGLSFVQAGLTEGMNPSKSTVSLKGKTPMFFRGHMAQLTLRKGAVHFDTGDPIVSVVQDFMKDPHGDGPLHRPTVSPPES